MISYCLSKLSRFGKISRGFGSPAPKIRYVTRQAYSLSLVKNPIKTDSSSARSVEHLQVRGRYGWPKHLDHRYGQIISFRWITRASRPRNVRTHFLGVTRGYFFPHPTTTISSRGAIRAFLLSFCILARSLFSRRVNFNDYISLGARARAQTRTVRESPKMFPWPAKSREVARNAISTIRSARLLKLIVH